MTRSDERFSPEETRAVLEARARALALPPEATDDGEVLQLVVFEIASERYAIESRFVIEVVRDSDVAVIPGAEPPLVGLTARRGDLLSVLDARPMLGLPAAGGTDSSRMVVLGEHRPSFGILVDSVLELREIPASAIRPLAGEARKGRELLLGTTSEAVLVLSAVDLIRAHT